MNVMLTRDERKLLNNFLDALDRLFDHQTTVSDLYALLEATAIALSRSSRHSNFAALQPDLRALVYSGKSLEAKRDQALYLTDDLRQFVAEELRRDELANPKQRHG